MACFLIGENDGGGREKPAFWSNAKYKSKEVLAFY